MKNVKKLLLRTLTTISFFAVNTASVFASGGLDPYNPYQPHKPIDTGLGDIEGIAIIGAILYTAGVGFIAYSQFMKKKFNK